MVCHVKSMGALCALENFTVNDVEADYSDFVEKYDHDYDNAEDYGCGDMRCDILDSTNDVLEKYGITEEEYQEIAEKVSVELNFGCCGWCV